MKLKQNNGLTFKSVFKLCAAFLFITVLMLVMNHYTPYYFDDYIYEKSWVTGEKITSLSQIIPSMVVHNNTMNGRFILHALAQFFFMIGENAFDIINSAAFTVFILLIYYHISGTLKDFKTTIFLAAFAMIWLFSPGFGESYLWTTGAANYLYGPLIGLAFLVPYRKYANDTSGNRSAFLKISGAVLYLLFGIIAGWTNENLSLCLIIIQVLFVLSFILTKDKLKIWMFTGLAGNIIGAILMFSSPTYGRRSKIWSGQSNLYDLVRGFVLIVMKFFEYFIVPVILICVVAVLYLSANRKKKIDIAQIRTPLVFLLAAMAFVGSTVACDYFPERAWTACLAFMVIAAGALFVKLNVKIKIKYVGAVALAFCTAVFLAGSYMNAVLDVRTMDYAYEQREAQINESLAKGEKTVALKPIEPATKYSCYYGKGDIKEAEYMRTRLARYYGFDSVTVDLSNETNN